MNVEQIATVCHAANMFLCLAHGDDSQKEWKDAE